MKNLKDVAKKAGVSIATVSRVINNSDTVNVATRRKVEKAIKQLGYRPSRVAQRLRSKEGGSKTIGLVLPDILNPFYVDVLRGVEDYTYANEYAVITCNFAQDEARENLYLDILQSESIDGIVLAPVHGRHRKVEQLVKAGLPIVCVDRGLMGADADVVLVDNRKGVSDALNHLISLGHKRIAFISGLPQIPTTGERLAGYKETLQKHSIPIEPELIKYGDSKHESGLRLSGELLKSSHPPTAIFTGNNLITLGALETIHSKGLRIPDDIAIVGFDDMYWSISLNPPLTAVSQPGYDMGQRAAELLLQRIKQPGRPTVKVVFDTELKIRKSCGA